MNHQKTRRKARRRRVQKEEGHIQQEVIEENLQRRKRNNWLGVNWAVCIFTIGILHRFNVINLLGNDTCNPKQCCRFSMKTNSTKDWGEMQKLSQIQDKSYPERCSMTGCNDSCNDNKIDGVSKANFWNILCHILFTDTES